MSKGVEFKEMGYAIELVLEDEEVNIPTSGGFYPSVAEEPYFIAKSYTCEESVTVSLSQLVAAAKKRGFIMELKEGSQ